ncbi:MAG: hypothetical protein P9M14_05645 [Candidatus Alcyoniella australis]|nr:hypothetical protein [Candidatus Alcyoniella australis]
MRDIRNSGREKPASPLCSKAQWAVAVLLAAATLLVFVSISVCVYPVDLDETMRFLETRLLLDHQVLLKDFFSNNFDPGAWIVFAPLAWIAPAAWSPLVSRCYGIGLLLLSLASLLWMPRLLLERRFPLATTCALALLAACPHLLFKVSELRQDAVCAAVGLLGMVLLLGSQSGRGRLGGVLAIWAAVCLRGEMALILAPLALAASLEVRARRLRLRWLAALLLTPLALLVCSLPFIWHWSWSELAEVPGYLSIAVLAKGDTSEPSYRADLFGILLVAVPALVELFRQIARPERSQLRALSLAVLGSVGLILGLHLVVGATFLQNYWSQIFMLAPFAGIRWARWLSALLHRSGLQSLRGWSPALLAACSLIMIAVPAKDFIMVRHSFASLSASALCADQAGKNTRPIEYQDLQIEYQAYSPLALSRSQLWLQSTVGERFSIYSNDFIPSVGETLPPHVVANLDQLLRMQTAMGDDPRSTRIKADLMQRFPQAFFADSGQSMRPGEYYLDRRPDVIVADDGLRLLVRFEPGLCELIRSDYRPAISRGNLPVYLKRAGGAPR